MLGIAAGAALLAILADRPGPRDRYVGGYPPAPYDYGRPYRGSSYLGAPPGSPVYDLPGGVSGRLAPGYVWIAAGAVASLDDAMDLALDVTDRGLPAQVYQSRAGDYVVVIGAADEWSARDEIRALADRGQLPADLAFLTDGRGFGRRLWAAPEILSDERTGASLSQTDLR